MNIYRTPVTLRPSPSVRHPPSVTLRPSPSVRHRQTPGRAMTETSTTTTDCLFDSILGFLLPFFLLGAGGDRTVATAAVRELIQAYNASTPTELGLAGRILGFS